MNLKNEGEDLRHPAVECPKGHAYSVSLKFFNRAVRRKRELICPRCLTSFKVKQKRRVV